MLISRNLRHCIKLGQEIYYDVHTVSDIILVMTFIEKRFFILWGLDLCRELSFFLRL